MRTAPWRIRKPNGKIAKFDIFAWMPDEEFWKRLERQNEIRRQLYHLENMKIISEQLEEMNRIPSVVPYHPDPRCSQLKILKE